MSSDPSFVRRANLKSDPDFADLDEVVVEFRLTYEGLLLGSSRNNTRAGHKHEIRRAFHPQLKRLWNVHPQLNNLISKVRRGKPQPIVEALAQRYERVGYNFVPLVYEDFHLACGLDVLFLRPDAPGEILRSGDIDNRLKTLFDALRMPKNKTELGNYLKPTKEEKPFYCLLEDDSLITQLGVTTDMLLQGINGDVDRNHARVVITVTLRPYKTTINNLGL